MTSCKSRKLSWTVHMCNWLGLSVIASGTQCTIELYTELLRTLVHRMIKQFLVSSITSGTQVQMLHNWTLYWTFVHGIIVQFLASSQAPQHGSFTGRDTHEWPHWIPRADRCWGREEVACETKSAIVLRYSVLRAVSLVPRPHGLGTRLTSCMPTLYPTPLYNLLWESHQYSVPYLSYTIPASSLHVHVRYVRSALAAEGGVLVMWMYMYWERDLHGGSLVPRLFALAS